MYNAALRCENEDYLEREEEIPWWLRGRDQDDARTRVLLIEDDRTTRRLVSAALESRCTVLEAPSGIKGLEKFAAHKPDIVFLDLQLPDQDGQDLLRTIIQQDPQAYVVLFSGHCDKDNIRQAMRNGAKGFVTKPFNVDLMVHYINQRFRP
ncbi:MAG: response regulator [Alphaproteobacteria bacterium]|nr:response regulator [Alphaproteobacteria bacterium]